MAQVKGTILIGRHTANHKAWLEGRGYKVTQEGNILTVEGTAFIDEIDLTEDPVGTLKAKVLATNSLMTYQTKAKVKSADGTVKTLKSIPLCTVLGPASALIVKPVGQTAPAKTNIFATL